MTINSPTPIIIGLIALIVIIIVLIAVVIGILSRRSRNKARAAESKKGAVQPRPQRQEILRLLRDPDTGRVITEFQNRTIRDPRTLSKLERDYLIRLAKDWTLWLGASEPQPEAKATPIPETPPAPSVPARPAAKPVIAAPVSVVAPVAEAQVNATVQPLAQAVPAVAPVPAVTPVPAVAPSPAAPAALSIVQQVDDILQEKLSTHPAPVPTIHLVEDPHEGVIVWLNGNKFVGIESVTDPDARAIIRSAAVEWEHRTEKL